MPKTFSDILGQPDAIEALRCAYLADRLPHGLIFAGPVGVGKATTALALGALFLCERPTADLPCGKCDSCKLFDSLSHPDYHVITKELIRQHDKTGKSKGTELAVNVIRGELLAKAAMKPAMNRGKVFVIEQAELMNREAQNAALKTLEEPAGRALIILLTDQPGMLLPTVQSRCQLIRFSPLAVSTVRKQVIARGIDQSLADRAAGLSDGSLGSALRWIEDGVIERAEELERRMVAIETKGAGADLADFLRKSADAYAVKQLERDELASKDQATRDGLTLYLRLASEHFRRRLQETSEDAALNRCCDAIDVIAEAQINLDANVAISLAMQNLSVALQNALQPPREHGRTIPRLQSHRSA